MEYTSEEMIKAHIFAGLLLLAAIAGCDRKPAPANLLARVEDRQITVEDYTTRYIDFLRKTGINDNLKVRHDFLKTLVNEAVILEYARQKQIHKEPELQTRLQNKCEQLYLDYYYENYIYPQLTISEAELREAFRRSKIRLHARHLYAPTLDAAFAIRKQLNQGKSFESLARELFNDPTLASNGGDLGWFSYDEMDPNFEDAAYSMQVGEISEPVKTSDGYSIIQLLDAEIDPFITESDYAKNEKWLQLQVKRRKHARFLEAKTDEILAQLELQFDPGGLEQLIQHFPLIRSQILDEADLMESHPVEPDVVLLISKNGNWTLQKAIVKLAELNRKQWNRIQNEDDLVQAITGLVIREEIERRIEEKEISNRPDVIHLANQKRDHVTLQYISEKLLDTLTISEEVLRDYFEAHRDEMVSSARYEIAEIAVSDSVVAGTLCEQLRCGADFGELARSYSQNERSSIQDGYLGWGTLEQFGKLSEKIRGSRSGDLLGPIRYYDKYMVLKVLDVQEPVPLEFDDARRLIESRVKPQAFHDAYYRMMNSARTELTIEIESGLVDKLNIDIKRGKS